jgi:branched-subunit amino acid ABC-type transport system permease component
VPPPRRPGSTQDADDDDHAIEALNAMHSLLLMALSLPSWQDEQPFLVTGLALRGGYALSGVGIIVLFRTTGVLNLSFGAVGAFGALIAWQLINHSGMNQWLAYLICILFAGALTLAYGMIFGPALARRDPLVKTTATLGLTLILLGRLIETKAKAGTGQAIRELLGLQARTAR